MQFEPSVAVAHWARYDPNNVAVILDDRAVTYSSLEQDVCSVAEVLSETFENDERIVVATQDKYSLIASVLGVVRTGKSAVVIHPHDDATALERCCDEAHANKAVVDPNTPLHITKLFDAGRTIDVSRLQPVQPSHPWPVAPPTSEWGVLYSSGTTGSPKGIVRDHYSVTVEALGWGLELGLRPGFNFYIGRPVFYTGGLLLTMSALLAGATVALPADVSWNAYQEHLARHPVDLAFMIPTQIREYLLDVASADEHPLSAKTILSMGELISAEEKARTRELLRSEVIESWGNTEGLGTITRPHDLDDAPESIGRRSSRTTCASLMTMVNHYLPIRSVVSREASKQASPSIAADPTQHTR